MTALDPASIDIKLVEPSQHPDHFPAEARDPNLTVSALNQLVEHGGKHSDVRHGIHAPMHKLSSLPLVQKLIPGLENLADRYHVGNFVAIRGGDKFFESMPIYPRFVQSWSCADDLFANAEVAFWV